MTPSPSTVTSGIAPTDLRPCVLNTAQAAAYLGSTESTLEKRRVYGGGPKFIKHGRAVRYRITDLDEFLKARTFSSTSGYVN